MNAQIGQLASLPSSESARAAPVAATATAAPMISVRNLTKTYKNGTRALKDISIDVRAGEFLVILGPSGAGKSTLLRCINRLVDPSEVPGTPSR